MPPKIENLDEIVGVAFWKYSSDSNKDSYSIIARTESSVHVVPKSSCDFEAIKVYLDLHKDKFYLSRKTINDGFIIIVYFRKAVIENGEFEFVRRYEHIATVGSNPWTVEIPREKIELFYKANSHNELLGTFYTLKTNLRRYLIDIIGITDEDIISNLELKYELEVLNN